MALGEQTDLEIIGRDLMNSKEGKRQVMQLWYLGVLYLGDIASEPICGGGVDVSPQLVRTSFQLRLGFKEYWFGDQ